jgi:hypothetical protein
MVSPNGLAPKVTEGVVEGGRPWGDFNHNNPELGHRGGGRP